MSVDYGDGEPVDNYQAGVRRAKQAMPCTACGLTIERGHLYHRTYYECDGDSYEHDRCARCQTMYLFLEPCVGQLSGDEGVDPDLDCGHVWSDNFDGEPPLAVQALAFLTPAEAQVLIGKPRFKNRTVWDESGDKELGTLSGPLEPEEHRIARLLTSIIGDRMPLPTEAFVAVEREDRDY
jgi:hypothetical protein